MKGKYFLDTNVFVYAFDRTNLKKNKIAVELIQDALESQKGIISFQVIQEFLNAATQKFEKPMNTKEAKDFLTRILEPLCEVFASFDIYKTSLEIKERWQYSFYDSLIIAAALSVDCEILYSEDFQSGQKIYGLEIINPFE